MKKELNGEKSFYLSTETVFLASTKPYHIAYLPTMMVLSSNNNRNLCILQTNKRREVYLMVCVVEIGGDWRLVEIGVEAILRTVIRTVTEAGWRPCNTCNTYYTRIRRIRIVRITCITSRAFEGLSLLCIEGSSQ
ncbi:expressed unknown protein [Seminavis robusta]|uniref:Uncharacterized protein n=1 Tax=Seminavis robusta TaxID=568900 RepID=A0A9N8EYX1_9STRA|nr:expressed unknown protein [Seminavis robusta]|eukprot:Sro2969_g341171.1  (135) ;mRNA; f:411-815